MTIEALAKRAGLSKVFVSKIERGERSASADSEQALADALGELVTDVFPRDGRMSPQEAASYYVENIRSRKYGTSEEDSEFMAFCRAHGLDPEEEAKGTDIVWSKDDDTLVIDGARFNEGVKKVRIVPQPIDVTLRIPRPRESRSRRKHTVKSSSSSDDPGDPEPAGGRRYMQSFVGADAPAGELERASTVGGQQAVVGSARFQRAA